ncbi:MAG: DNA-3-methyladenine glycosylase [Phycisphaerales bacterium JB037]
MSRLFRQTLARPSDRVAVDLLGQRLVRILPDGSRLAGIIVETEAYLGVTDRAAHSFGGRRTPRVESMYARAGTAYVYFTYGMHHCFNVVAGKPGEPVAVLIRALEPVEGLDAMFAARAKAKKPEDLCSGPGKLCQALAIDRTLDGEDLIEGGVLFLERASRRPIRTGEIVRTPRIGVESAGKWPGRWAERPLRWYLPSPHVSVRRRGDRPGELSAPLAASPRAAGRAKSPGSPGRD